MELFLQDFTATQVNNTNKTEVELAWVAPSRGLGENVTFWCVAQKSIVADFILWKMSAPQVDCRG